MRRHLSFKSNRRLAVRVGRKFGRHFIKRWDFIFDRRCCGEKVVGKKSAMLTSNAFARKTKSQSVIRFRVTSICARPLRLIFQPNEPSFVDRSLCVQSRNFRRCCNCGPTIFSFSGLFMFFSWMRSRFISSDGIAKPLVASKRTVKVLRLCQAGRGVRRWNGETERRAVAKAASL